MGKSMKMRPNYFFWIHLNFPSENSDRHPHSWPFGQSSPRRLAKMAAVWKRSEAVVTGWWRAWKSGCFRISGGNGGSFRRHRSGWNWIGGRGVMMGNGYHYSAANIMTFNPNVPERLRAINSETEKKRGGVSAVNRTRRRRCSYR